ncbi:hypothetical protein CW751_12685 [Brumimicrobium salinarum]|uniref:Outer membrane protein beta-barrel domain-containing protein n=1 Tax=Brumimicrobium salinarum TaxID=2058658 RepID=A0A2I0R044_9FLAO|nr:outer membrane beta-barrel protein [Brumimicrobium salinarum]PKR79933.1 hypothetical protein CW751_12685 [Brumimicrobium salinarum]
MKKIIIISLTLFFSSFVFSQHKSTNAKHLNVNWHKVGWFLEANGGMRLLGKTSEQADMKPGLSLTGGVGYFINEQFGVRGRLDYQGFNTETVNSSNSSYSIGLSAEALLRTLNAFGGVKNRAFEVVAHGGIGGNSLINPELRDYVRNDLGKEFEDGGFKGTDDMFHIVIGATPEYHFNSKLSLNLDISHFIQFGQHRTYDVFSKELADGPTGVFVTSLGLTVRL